MLCFIREQTHRHCASRMYKDAMLASAAKLFNHAKHCVVFYRHYIHISILHYTIPIACSTTIYSSSERFSRSKCPAPYLRWRFSYLGKGFGNVCCHIASSYHYYFHKFFSCYSYKSKQMRRKSTENESIFKKDLLFLPHERRG